MQCESASRCSRCCPDGGREEAFEWQKWNIDKTRGHKHTAWLKMWPDGWHLISQCLLVSSFLRGGWLSPADLHSWRLYPENPWASVKRRPPTATHSNPPPPRAELECEKKKKSFTYRALNLQQRSQSPRLFHYWQDLFICLSKWLCCYRLFSESLSLSRGRSRQFQQLCLSFWCLSEQRGSVKADRGFLKALRAGGRENDQTLVEKKRKAKPKTARFSGVSSKCVIMSH